MSAIGIGSGSGSQCHAFVDDVTFGINEVTTNFNVEVTASQAVPEPASNALLGLGLGLGLVGLVAVRRRQRRAA